MEAASDTGQFIKNGLEDVTFLGLYDLNKILNSFLHQGCRIFGCVTGVESRYFKKSNHSVHTDTDRIASLKGVQTGFYRGSKPDRLY